MSSVANEMDKSRRISAYIEKDGDRKCRDVLCTLAFAVYWVGMFVVLGVALSSGEPKRLFYGTDYSGAVCGTEGTYSSGVLNGESYNYKEKVRMYYPRLQKDIAEAYLDDPSKYNPAVGGNPLNIPFFGVCVKECPKQGDTIKNPHHAKNGEPTEWPAYLTTSEVFYRCVPDQPTNASFTIKCTTLESTGNRTPELQAAFNMRYPCTGKKNCKDVLFAQIDEKFKSENAACQTSEMIETKTTNGGAKDDPIYDQMNGYMQTVKRWVGDLQKALLPVFFCGGLLAVVLGFVWVMLLRHCAGFMVWFTVFAILAVEFAVTLYLCVLGNLIKTDSFSQHVNTNIFLDAESAETAKLYECVAYLFIVISLITLCLVIFLHSRIAIAVGIIKEASKALQAMTMLLAFPLLPAVLTIGILFYFVLISAYIMTAGDVTMSDVAAVAASATANSGVNTTSALSSVASYQGSATQGLLLYHLFGILWTNQVIEAISVCTVAGAVCNWYFSIDKSKSLGHTPVLRSLKRTLYYHFGSVCLGACIIAIIQFIRIILEYIDHKTKDLQGKNAVLKAVMCVVKVYMWCLEKCVKYISRNAYIMVAMTGQSFCTSMVEAFNLILSNITKIGTVNVISTFLLLLGKLVIVCFCNLIMFAMISPQSTGMASSMGFMIDKIGVISSPVFPMITTFIFSYSIASYFMNIYGMAIDTILLCFCRDKKDNKATGEFFMSDELAHFVENDARKHAFAFHKAKFDEEGAAPHVGQQAVELAKRTPTPASEATV